MTKAPTPRGPSRIEILNATDEAERVLTEMIGRWEDHIPAHVRAELHRVAAPLLAILMRAGRR